MPAARLGAVRLVAIDGPSGSGKSGLADRVVGRLRGAGVGVELVRTDYFATWDEPVGWWPRLVEGVLEPLAAGRPGGYRRMEWLAGRPRPGEWVRVGVPEVLVVEGVSAGRRSVRERLSALVWCEHPDPVERLERAVARDGEACRAPLQAWQRFEEGWFAIDAPVAVATVRYPNGGNPADAPIHSIG
ncbi:MAG TPA: uridine kinase [Actinophytocola sp.]|uniref:uridine kinase family protein n=1 Tax=Actinophytocola sp. TaxID=1872138 RepID=UPI002DC05752|nr:uridine kinase [Actinophytocola sp.]HEU5470869.1 uridine kinase [Actinophytocola sp.]